MHHRESLNLLRRDDKIVLGGGGRLLFAPQFPLHPRARGLWDGACFLNYPLEPLFTWTLLDENGGEVPLRRGRHDWDPAGRRTRWEPPGTGGSVSAEEYLAVFPDDRADMTLDLRNRSRRTQTIHLVVWTALRLRDEQDTLLYRSAEADGHYLRWTTIQHPAGRPALRLRTTLSVSPHARSHEVRVSEGRTAHPDWSAAPFAESFRRGRLASIIHETSAEGTGVVFLALHTRTVLPPGGTRRMGARLTIATGDEPDRSGTPARVTRSAADESERLWKEYTAGLPSFTCSDPRFTAWYWYRWFGLRLNTVRTATGAYREPFVCEGIGGFRAPISYSAPCHMLENRWLHDPALAQGSLAVFLQTQRPGGAFRGYIDPFHERNEMFYHAHWGHALRQLLLVHPSVPFAAEAYDGLAQYARYFDRERDGELSGLYDIRNHYETGQEYMRRYVVVEPDADRRHWGEVFRLKGVDVTVYLYELKKTLGWLARMLDRPEDGALWETQAARIREAVRSAMWDPEEEMFFDVDPATGRRTGVKAAVCFYPYMTDIADDSHLGGLRRHLFRRKEFWTPFPVPSSSADDPLFSAEPVWKGKRMSCPWNGRVWPMTNSHLAEALGNSAVRSGEPSLRRRTAEFLTTFIHMMFFDGNPRRPNCFEHYNPLTGRPSVYRGIDDYQHSWVNDLIIRWVCGVRPEEDHVVVDPFPFGLERFELTNLRVRGRQVSVTLRGNTVTLACDGALTARAPLGKPIILHI